MSDEEICYINPPYEDAVTLNEKLYFKFVTEDGNNFKFPFIEGTTCYLDVNTPPFVVDERILQLAETDQFVADLLLNKLTETEALLEGWFPGL